MMKTCTKCKATKDETAFSLEKHRGKFYRRGTCKECLDCGGYFEAVQMDFDHTDEDTKEATIARLVGGPTEKLLNEILKCHLVCTVCHRVRTHTGVKKHNIKQAQQIVTLFKTLEAQTSFPSDRRYTNYPWLHLVGTVPDKELAAQVGVSREMVGWLRRKQGIVLRSTKNRILYKSWHVLVGTMSDQKVASIGGTTRTNVARYRKKMGIPSFRQKQKDIYNSTLKKAA